MQSSLIFQNYVLADYFGKAEYTRKYTYIPPEVIKGETRQSVYSNVFFQLSKLCKTISSNMHTYEFLL